MATVAPTRRRNIQRAMTFDRERLDAAEALARAQGVSLSGAVSMLIDRHAGILTHEAEERAQAPEFDPSIFSEKKLTRELISTIAGSVREGSTNADAYRGAEVPAKQGEKWERQGLENIERGKRGIYSDLVMSLWRARAEFNIEVIRELRAKGDAKSVLKMLDDSEQFREVKHSTMDVSVKFTPLVEWERMPLEKARLLKELLQEFSPSADDPAVTRTSRPAIEAVPVDVLEAIEDGEWTEAPALETKPEH